MERWTKTITFFFQGRLQPSRMLLIDTANRVIIGDDEIKMSIARSRPHSEWLGQLVTLDDIRKTSAVITNFQPKRSTAFHRTTTQIGRRNLEDSVAVQLHARISVSATRPHVYKQVSFD